MSNSDSEESFNESDDYIDSEDEYEYQKQTKASDENNLIGTEGVDQSVLENINLTSINNVTQCHCCSKYYNKSLIINDTDGMGEQMCKHCFCWLNYDVETRLDFDNKCIALHGFCIAEYILTCYEAHDTNTCTRMTDKGGCLLCDYILNLDITNILNKEMLPKFFPKKQSQKNEEKTLRKIMIVDNDVALQGAKEYLTTTKLLI